MMPVCSEVVECEAKVDAFTKCEVGEASEEKDSGGHLGYVPRSGGPVFVLPQAVHLVIVHVAVEGVLQQLGRICRRREEGEG